MWGINVIHENICSLTGVIIGVTVSTDNGDNQYLTKVEYEKLLKNREGLLNDIPTFINVVIKNVKENGKLMRQVV